MYGIFDRIDGRLVATFSRVRLARWLAAEGEWFISRGYYWRRM
jgi:hypothetical protein